jgi:uncharacterized protein (TIGR02453 family)
MNYFTPDFLKFFKELAPNNNKDWFDVNRERYFKSVKTPFEIFVNDLILNIQKIDKEIKVGAKECIHRINNDIRFSKDKTIYKMYRSAIITPSGRKNGEIPGFYFEMGPEKVSFYGGAYFLPPDQLQSMRKHIAKNLKEFDKLINDRKFVKMYGELQGEESARIPKEFKAAAEKQPLLMRKQFYFGTDLKASTVTDKDVMKITMEHYKVANPLMQFLRRGI